MLVAKQLH